MNLNLLTKCAHGLGLQAGSASRKGSLTPARGLKLRKKGGRKDEALGKVISYAAA